jgi:hypothetical protein
LLLVPLEVLLYPKYLKNHLNLKFHYYHLFLMNLKYHYYHLFLMNLKNPKYLNFLKFQMHLEPLVVLEVL